MTWKFILLKNTVNLDWSSKITFPLSATASEKNLFQELAILSCRYTSEEIKIKAEYSE